VFLKASQIFGQLTRVVVRLGILGYSHPMSFRDSLLDNFAGDLEYHPRRGAVYLVLAVAAFCRFYFAPADSRFSATSLVFAFGAATLLIKGLFLCRKSSEGLGLSETDLNKLSSRKDLPTIPNLVAQIVQDFGAGPLFLWPLLRISNDTTLPRTLRLSFRYSSLALFFLA
jgi:hypothetical protein